MKQVTIIALSLENVNITACQEVFIRTYATHKLHIKAKSAHTYYIKFKEISFVAIMYVIKMKWYGVLGNGALRRRHHGV